MIFFCVWIFLNVYQYVAVPGIHWTQHFKAGQLSLGLLWRIRDFITTALSGLINLRMDGFIFYFFNEYVCVCMCARYSLNTKISSWTIFTGLTSALKGPVNTDFKS